ncbi:MAG: hypothetical protein N3G20_02285 [Verrucomicrobiae bacterium]|nr:hypothetical protein [Verrucomicrobiae bacterium]
MKTSKFDPLLDALLFDNDMTEFRAACLSRMICVVKRRQRRRRMLCLTAFTVGLLLLAVALVAVTPKHDERNHRQQKANDNEQPRYGDCYPHRSWTT